MIQNIKNRQKERGFTIVELLVVIVVIGILAAITIVSYTGVSTRAKGAQAVSNANSVAKVAEAIFADNSRYPGTIAEFNSMNSVARIPTGVNLIAVGSITASNGQTNFAYSYVGSTASTATGGRVRYWIYGTDTTAPTGVLYLGSATSGSTFVDVSP